MSGRLAGGCAQLYLYRAALRELHERDPLAVRREWHVDALLRGTVDAMFVVVRLAAMPRWSSANGISRATLGMSAASLAWCSKNSPMAGKSCMTTPAKR